VAAARRCTETCIKGRGGGCAARHALGQGGRARPGRPAYVCRRARMEAAGLFPGARRCYAGRARAAPAPASSARRAPAGGPAVMQRRRRPAPCRRVNCVWGGSEQRYAYGSGVGASRFAWAASSAAGPALSASAAAGEEEGHICSGRLAGSKEGEAKEGPTTPGAVPWAWPLPRAPGRVLCALLSWAARARGSEGLMGEWCCTGTTARGAAAEHHPLGPAVQ
jgi:hypothetical protein